MRTKFRSIHECMQVWARQSQDRGECGNVSFNGPVLYSYSLAIAKIIGNATLIYNGFNSVTTNKHVVWARQAVPGNLLPVHVVCSAYCSETLWHKNNLVEMVDSMIIAADKWTRARCNKERRRSEAVSHGAWFIQYMRLFDLGELVAVQYPMLPGVVALDDFDALRAWCLEFTTVQAVMGRIGGRG
jgi:hypothetical protein